MGMSKQPLQIYKRVTFVVQDVGQAQVLAANPATNIFDIIAVTPTNEKTFTLACTSMDVDIIVIDCSVKLPYFLKVPAIRSAIARGIHFEVCLGPALGNPASRQYFFTNFSTLVRATNGQNILLSGEASQPADLRAPNDIANVCALVGLDFATAKAALSATPYTVIKRGESRKASRGVLRVIDS